MRKVGHPVSTWRFLPDIIDVQFHHLWLYDIKEACPPASLPVPSSENRKSHTSPRGWLWALYEIVPVTTSTEGKGELPHRPTWWSPALCLFSFLFLFFFFNISYFQFSSVTQLCPTLQYCGLQHARFPCPSPTPGARSNSCPVSRWCHPTISSSVVPFSSCPQSFPASGSFLMSWFFASCGQSTRVSASVLPMNIQDLFSLGLTGLISLQSKGLSRVISNTIVKSINSSVLSLLYSLTLTSIHDYWKNRSLTIRAFVGK